MAYSYEQELDALKNAQKKAAVADLSNTRNQTLSNLQNESMKNTANFAAQRNVANVQNRIGNKNFQEYLASTGRANTGLAAQARLQSRNNLNTQLNNINSAENAARADINRQITNANNTYNTGLTAANANIEANYINNLLDQRYKAQQQANDERDFNERVRQFNAQLYSNFNSGGGGFDDTTSGDFTDTLEQLDNPTEKLKKETTYSRTNDFVNVDMGNKTEHMVVYEGSDGHLYYKNNGKYIKIK